MSDVLWIDKSLPLHVRLTESAVTIIENLLKSKGIDYLAVSGRTKSRESALEKVKRKGYKSPQSQMTDVSGVRIILYFESDVDEVSRLIEMAFGIDKDNSLNRGDLMSSDQIGYRSVHYVCHLGDGRANLPEFSGLAGLKFEIQVRTVLQHAWAELAHDRNYKFTGKLPKKLERQLYLYAGMLEIADRGFDEISTQIDEYIDAVDKKSDSGDFNLEIDSISLQVFVKAWAEKENVRLRDFPVGYVDELIRELEQFRITKLEELNAIIPEGYAKVLKQYGVETNGLGLVRDWMVIHDFKRFYADVNFNWCYEEDSSQVVAHYLTPEEFREFLELYEVMSFEEFEGEDDYISSEE